MDNQLRATLLARLGQSEDPWVERKQSLDEQKVRRTVVGFANTLGEGQTAVMFIGADNKGQHKGVGDADDAQKKIRGILERCYPPINYQTHVLPVEVEGNRIEIVAILVPCSKDRPHFAGPAYVRRGSETVEASHEQFLELIASQNERARRILQFKGKKAWLRLTSQSGFWYEHEGLIDFCDAITVRFIQTDGPRYAWSFPIPDVEIHNDPMRDLVITAKPPWTEEEHIRKVVERWISSSSSAYIDKQNSLLAQLLANPEKAMTAVATEADGTRDVNLKRLLAHLRFEVKKVRNPRTREQKLEYLREAQRRAAEKAQRTGIPAEQGSLSAYMIYMAQVDAVAEVATSLDEVSEFLDAAIAHNPEEIQKKQREELFQRLGLPHSETA